MFSVLKLVLTLNLSSPPLLRSSVCLMCQQSVRTLSLSESKYRLVNAVPSTHHSYLDCVWEAGIFIRHLPYTYATFSTLRLCKLLLLPGERSKLLSTTICCLMLLLYWRTPIITLLLLTFTSLAVFKVFCFQTLAVKRGNDNPFNPGDLF